ncbi:ABC transporter substrate-binding protein [Aromatoleum toluclasticum]|uniref:MlaC/ttg2D family ABC transporter substrate-binding protein n=1 Tax=Aromatoleum toluclasticum TaxID=92003 RepID=UPI001D17E46C|nr:ABC transporter substrate-binding protein [Aromatoleum toluclasticum]MCC4118377.1 ABC transporter substrate-binding protein [Aromatoleum toluclasticum]
MIRQLRTCLVCLPLMLAPLALHAQETSPDALVKGVTEDVLTVLREDKALQGGDQRKAMTLIEEKIGPHFDFPRMTSLAVGQGWRQAAPEQREALTREFRTLLVRTYANALTSYKNQTVSYKPATPGREDGGAMVRTQINQPGGQPIAVDYRLAKNSGAWKVFDVSIDNVSLVTNYRGSFATEMSKGGPDALIRTLQEKNRGAAPKPAKGGNA